MAWLLCSGTEDWTYCLLPKAVTADEATPSSVQHSKAYSSSRWPNHRMENKRPPTTHSHWQRSGVGSRGDTRQLLALEILLSGKDTATNTIPGSLPPKSLYQNSQWSSIANTLELWDTSDTQSLTTSFILSPLFQDIAILKGGWM